MADAIEIVGNDYPFFNAVSGERDGLDLRYQSDGGHPFKAVLEDLPFQVNEFSLANYTLMRDRGIDRMVAFPVFLNREFRHGALHVRKDSDLTHPSQLKGKKVGAREYTQTAGVWWRGTMIDEYDLHWSDLNWVIGPVQRFTPPEAAKAVTVEGDLEQMLIDGEIDAYLAPNIADAKKPEGERKLRSIFPDTEAEERAYYARTGIFPLNHAMVIHKDWLAQYPQAPKAVFDACCASKAAYYAANGMTDPWGGPSDVDVMPFGLTEKNRADVQTLWRYLHEQGFISRVPEMEPSFVEGAAGFVDL